MAQHERTVEVGFHHFPDDFDGNVQTLHTDIFPDGRVVDQDIQMPEFIGQKAGYQINATLIGDIQGMEYDIQSLLFQLLLSGFTLGNVSRREDGSYSLFCKRTAYTKANAFVAARYDGDFLIRQLSSPLSVWIAGSFPLRVITYR